MTTLHFVWPSLFAGMCWTHPLVRTPSYISRAIVVQSKNRFKPNCSACLAPTNPLRPNPLAQT